MCKERFDIVDGDGNVVAMIKGSNCVCRCSTEVTFKVINVIDTYKLQATDKFLIITKTCITLNKIKRKQHTLSRFVTYRL